ELALFRSGDAHVRLQRHGKLLRGSVQLGMVREPSLPHQSAYPEESARIQQPAQKNAPPTSHVDGALAHCIPFREDAAESQLSTRGAVGPPAARGVAQ